MGTLVNIKLLFTFQFLNYKTRFGKLPLYLLLEEEIVTELYAVFYPHFMHFKDGVI
jgi:hypothetical protein